MAAIVGLGLVIWLTSGVWLAALDAGGDSTDGLAVAIGAAVPAAELQAAANTAVTTIAIATERGV